MAPLAISAAYPLAPALAREVVFVRIVSVFSRIASAPAWLAPRSCSNCLPSSSTLSCSPRPESGSADFSRPSTVTPSARPARPRTASSIFRCPSRFAMLLLCPHLVLQRAECVHLLCAQRPQTRWPHGPPHVELLQPGQIGRAHV